MSKNITIQEGGVARQLTVDKLKTNLVDSGTCLWVPEDEVQLTTKYITENGTYKAVDENYYGYSEVTVSGIGVATGTDGDGDEAYAHTGDGGGLEIDKIPSSIAITTEPSKMSYVDGELINTSGMVVKAYYATGGEWGIVPPEEIVISPVSASIEASEEEPDKASSELTTGLDQPINCGDGRKVISREYMIGRDHYTDKRTDKYSGVEYTFIEQTSTVVFVVAASDTPNAVATIIGEKELTNETTGVTEKTVYESQREMGSSFTYAGKTVYYTMWTEGNSGFSRDSLFPVSTGNPANYYDEIAWTMVYGDKIPGGWRQTIAVQWQRPGDYKLLETTLSVTVEQN